jgi:hypothetical protein
LLPDLDLGDLAGERGQHEARRLSRPDVVKRPHPNDRQSKADEILIPHHILRHFADAVGIFRAERLVFGDGERSRRGATVLLTGADDEDARLQGQGQTGFKQVELSPDVIFQGVPRVFVGGRHVGLRGRWMMKSGR